MVMKSTTPMIRPLRSAHRQQQDDEHDDDGHDQVLDEVVDRHGHRVGLERDTVQFHAERNPRAELLDAGAGPRRPSSRRCRRRPWRCRCRSRACRRSAARWWADPLVAPDGGDVLEIDELVGLADAADEQIFEILHAGPFAGRVDRDRRSVRRRPSRWKPRGSVRAAIQKSSRDECQAAPCGRAPARCKSPPAGGRRIRSSSRPARAAVRDAAAWPCRTAAASV